MVWLAADRGGAAFVSGWEEAHTSPFCKIPLVAVTEEKDGDAEDSPHKRSEWDRLVELLSRWPAGSCTGECSPGGNCLVELKGCVFSRGSAEIELGLSRRSQTNKGSASDTLEPGEYRLKSA